MILAIVTGASMIVGFVVAETWHRISLRRNEVVRQRQALLAEYLEKKLWQFISIDEWLEGNARQA